MTQRKLNLIGTCPSSSFQKEGLEYINKIKAAAQWIDKNGWEAILIYTSNRQIDPWLIAQIIIQNTNQLHPLVAVQPIYSHPYTVAKNIASLNFFYNRPVYVNMVAGDFPRDREALGDSLSHDKRYDRVIEYGNLLNSLLTSRNPVTFQGEYYSTNNLHMAENLYSSLEFQLTVSGSSYAGINAAKQLGARAIQYPKPAYEYANTILEPEIEYGIRLGIIVRESNSDAWESALERYPTNSDGVELRKYASALSDSVWVKELSKEIKLPQNHPYWLSPYKNYQSACPFLVGSFEEIAKELSEYIKTGFTTYLLELPENEDDAYRISAVFKLANDIVSTQEIVSNALKDTSTY